MGNFGRRRVVEALEWRYEAPKLIAAYQALWHPVKRPVPVRRSLTQDDMA